MDAYVVLHMPAPASIVIDVDTATTGVIPEVEDPRTTRYLVVKIPGDCEIVQDVGTEAEALAAARYLNGGPLTSTSENIEGVVTDVDEPTWVPEEEIPVE
jgi:hypothetical protein